MRRFPSLAALARAPLDSVLKAWEGMGYYARARNLHRAARQVVGEHGGRLPRSAAELTKLPGVGRYTAGAILSFAYHQDAPILDTNVQRLLQRYFNVQGDPTRTPARKQLWRLAEQVIPPGQGYTMNQALLDFGAIVCIARKPRCRQCPLNQNCPYPKDRTRKT